MSDHPRQPLEPLGHQGREPPGFGSPSSNKGMSQSMPRPLKKRIQRNGLTFRALRLWLSSTLRAWHQEQQSHWDAGKGGSS